MSLVIEVAEVRGNRPVSQDRTGSAWGQAAQRVKASLLRMALCLRGACETDPELTEWVPQDIGLYGPLAERAWRRHGAYLAARKAYEERCRSESAKHG